MCGVYDIICHEKDCLVDNTVISCSVYNNAEKKGLIQKASSWSGKIQAQYRWKCDFTQTRQKEAMLYYDPGTRKQRRVMHEQVWRYQHIDRSWNLVSFHQHLHIPYAKDSETLHERQQIKLVSAWPRRTEPRAARDESFNSRRL
jgi:hypothetical protein